MPVVHESAYSTWMFGSKMLTLPVVVVGIG
jgi:hypothetical protein